MSTLSEMLKEVELEEHLKQQARLLRKQQRNEDAGWDIEKIKYFQQNVMKLVEERKGIVLVNESLTDRTLAYTFIHNHMFDLIDHNRSMKVNIPDDMFNFVTQVMHDTRHLVKHEQTFNDGWKLYVNCNV